MATIRVKNNRASLVHIPSGKGEQFALMPGMNEVPTEVWKAVTEPKNGAPLPAVMGMIDDGTLELDGAKMTAAEKKAEGLATTETGASAPLGDLSESEAVTVVKNTYDRGTLEGYKAVDSRAKVQKQIDDQLASLALTPEETQTAGKGAKAKAAK